MIFHKVNTKGQCVKNCSKDRKEKISLSTNSLRYKKDYLEFCYVVTVHEGWLSH